MVLCWMSVCLSIRDMFVCTFVFSFQDNYSSKCHRTFTKLSVCTWLLSRSVLGLLFGKFHQFLTVLPALFSEHPYFFSS